MLDKTPYLNVFKMQATAMPPNEDVLYILLATFTLARVDAIKINSSKAIVKQSCREGTIQRL